MRKLITIFLDVPHDLIVTFTRDLERSASPAVQFVGSGGGAPDRRRHRALISHPPPPFSPVAATGMSPTIIWVSIIGFVFVVGFLYKKVQELTMASTKEIPLEDCVGHKDNVHVFIDFGIKDRFKDDLIGRVEFELFTNKLPLTCENFRCFITGEKGDGATGKPMHYKGVKFHRIIPGFMLQGGDHIQGGEAAHRASTVGASTTSGRTGDTSSTRKLVSCPWPTADREPTDRSFSSHSRRRGGSTEGTSSSGAS